MGTLLILFAVTIASLGLGVVPMALYISGERHKRELEHVERMRALELGHPLPGGSQDESWYSPMRIALAIGAGVPLGAFFCAAISTLAIGFREGIWIVTGLASMSGVICGSSLAGHHLTVRHKANGYGVAKPLAQMDFD
jgi:hypothetical protein